MDRLILPADKVSPAAREVIAARHRALVEEVAATVARDKVVVVGMAQNPYVRKARKLLRDRGVTFTYLEYGSYLGRWAERLSIKLWAGFATFPMIFIDGVLVGGFKELTQLDADGKLPKA